MGDDEDIEQIRQRALAAGKSPHEAQRIVNELVIKATREALPGVVQATLDSMPEMLEEHREYLSGFHERVRLHWGPALDLLFVIVADNSEMSEKFRTTTSPRRKDPLWQSLSGLYSRATRIGFEVHHLLSGGFPLGAYARARTLHEIAIIVKILADHHSRPGAEDLAERYQLHYLILEYKDALAYKDAFGDSDPEVNEQVRRGTSNQAALCARFGKEFKEAQGWAFPLTNHAKAGIVDLEKLAGLDHLRSLYKSMSHEIHADAMSWRMNLVERDGIVHSLNGPTNIMFEEPAFLAMNSLREVAGAVLLSKYCTKRNLLPLWTFDELIVRANDAFEAGGESVAEAEERYQAEYGGDNS